MFVISEELKKLPASPGVYLMKNAVGKVIYVGKAVNLKNRVRQYFQNSSNHADKIRVMVTEIAEFEFIVTDTELEAFILECNLIKKYWPQYNTKLKDNTTYPYIKVTVNEIFPRVMKVNKYEKDKAKYFGPYTSNTMVLDIIETIRSLWPLRRCSKKFPACIGKDRPCLNYHMGLCRGPCGGEEFIGSEEYGRIVNELMKFLSGKYKLMTDKLEEDMRNASEAMEYEKAAVIRDKIIAINRLSEKQNLEHASDSEMDVVAFSRVKENALFMVFFVRGGKLVGKENYILEETENLADDMMVNEFIKQYYTEFTYIPKEIVISAELPERELIMERLCGLKSQNRADGGFDGQIEKAGRRNGTVMLTVPAKGEKLDLLNMAKNNADMLTKQSEERLIKERQQTIGALAELAKSIGADYPLDRIEAYDISNVQGYESVGSMIVYERGKPKNSDYRKFKIKNVEGADDYASMKEVISRRFKRYIEETENNTDDMKAKFSKLPDIIFVDGGKGHVNSVLEVLAELNIKIDVCGMVKDDRHRTRGLYFNNNEINLPPHSEGFRLLTRIQDEVHRFAVEYHRKLRSDASIRSVLDEIKGVGAARRKSLIKHFKSVDNIRKAGIKELSEVDKMTKAAAEAVYYYFRQ